MTVLEIILLLIGVVFLVVSFFVSEKLSSGDLKEIKRLNEQEIKTLMEKNLRESSQEIEEILKHKMEEALEELEQKTDKETNQKIMAISEFSDTVLDSMNKSHNEIVFMYNMLTEKQEQATELTRQLQMMESSILQMETALEEKREELQELMQQHIEISMQEQQQEPLKSISMEEALLEHQEENQEREQSNEKILNLYRQGVNEVEIAKQLGRGLGEVKLVLGLFSDGEKR